MLHLSHHHYGIASPAEARERRIKAVCSREANMFDTSVLIPKLLENMLDKVGVTALTVLFGGIKKFRETLTMNFAEYLYSTTDYASHVKTLLHRDERVDLFSIYVETYLKSGNNTVRDNTLINRACRSPSNIFVVGSAGSGKSMFIKYLFLQLVENSFGIMPILIELRGLNMTESNVNLFDFIYDSVVRPGAVVTKDQFRGCLREGLFLLIFDGLDEVEYNRRPAIDRQIINIHQANPRLGIVISSRPDERLSSFADFRLFHIQPMKRVQITRLLNKLPYDQQLKRQFIREVENHLYSQHESFLSNPLLATMMLMTYDQFAHIPEKIHVFYEQAFQTLFFRHDASKDAAFRRIHYTDLPINNFRNCLSALCISSYFREKYQFSEPEILDYIRIAAKFESLEVKEVDYLQDLLESLCILQRDGLFVSFTHRSFQEYFAAVFISRGPSISIGELLDIFCERPADNVLQMAFDMNRPLIEREWMLGKISAVAGRIKSEELANNIVEFGEMLFDGQIFIEIKDETALWSTRARRNGGWPFLSILWKLYPEYFIEVVDAKFDDADYQTIREELTIRGMLPSRHLTLRLGAADHEWVMKISLGRFLRRQYDALLALEGAVAASVTHQKRLAGTLFQWNF
jgi:hypothetical protein